jgi:hypothetical protein
MEACAGHRATGAPATEKKNQKKPNKNTKRKKIEPVKRQKACSWTAKTNRTTTKREAWNDSSLGAAEWFRWLMNH